MSTYSTSPPPPGETARERNNRIVGDLSSRVVAGWTLLASTCPICQTALVRQRDGPTYCVGCRMSIVSEAEARQRNLASPSVASTARSSSSTSTSTSAASPRPSIAVPAISPTNSTARSPSSRASASTPTSAASAINGLSRTSSTGLALSPSASSSSSSAFSMFRADAMSPSAPPRDESSGSASLRSLSSSPHYGQLVEQLSKARDDAAPRQSPVAASANTVSSAAPNASATAATPVSAPVVGGGADEERAVSSRVSRTNSLSARLGEKMLAGWTLLGVHCAEDHCPLMKNPRTGDMLCVDCGTVYPPEGQDSSSAPTGNAASAPVATSSTSAPSASASSLVAITQQPIVVSVNGTSTATQLRAAPTNHRASDGVASDDSDEEDDDSDERLDRLAAARLGRVNGSPHADTNGSPPPSSTASTATVNDVSAALSEKLLQGWTMLAVECPNPTCACPLVRKKQGPMLCVQCGSTVVTQEEKDSMDANERKTSATSGGGASAEQKATEAKAAEDETSAQQRERAQSASTADSSSQQQQSKKESEERSSGRSGKRTAFADEAGGAAPQSGEKRLKNEDDLSDRLSALSSSSLVSSLSASPLIRPSSSRPSAISFTRPPVRAPPLTDASPSTHTPPSTPAPFPFNSPLPASQHLSASISSGFTSHPVFPPPGHITRHNSMAGGDGLPYNASVGMGSLSFGGGAVSQPHSRIAQLGVAHERGKFSFRSSSAAPSVSQPSAPASSGLLSAPPSAIGGEGVGLASPITVSPANSDGGGVAAVAAARPPQVHHASVLSSSVEALYIKLDGLRGQLVTCSQVDAMQQIAMAMKEIGQALKVLQSL